MIDEGQEDGDGAQSLHVRPKAAISRWGPRLTARGLEAFVSRGLRANHDLGAPCSRDPWFRRCRHGGGPGRCSDRTIIDADLLVDLAFTRTEADGSNAVSNVVGGADHLSLRPPRLAYPGRSVLERPCMSEDIRRRETIPVIRRPVECTGTPEGYPANRNLVRGRTRDRSQSPLEKRGEQRRRVLLEGFCARGLWSDGGRLGRSSGLGRSVSNRVMSVAIARHTAAGGEAGTAPGDRPFRPDVQGLRAVAILLVVLYHAAIPGISGGYVGVDVFFVISGFVITGLLLKERIATRRTWIVNFYGRRARRVVPAASLVIIVTVVAAFHSLGSLTGHETTVDGQWAAVFLANFHFAASQTNYLASQQPPSPLQNFWSLAVEEQFYIVYPTIFLITAGLARGISLRGRLAIVLVTVVVASYAYSIVFTSSNAPSAFFSPLTASLGACTGWPQRGSRARSPWRASVLGESLFSWLGLAAIVTASLTLTSATVYPGALVAIPVLGAGLVIAGGAAQPVWGVERLLRQKPFQLLGLISYSLYLWHWPILIIATQSRRGNSLAGLGQRLVAPGRDSGGGRRLFSYREPGAPLKIPHRTTVGFHRSGRLPHWRHARLNVRAAEAYRGPRGPRHGDLGLDMSVHHHRVFGLGFAIHVFVRSPRESKNESGAQRQSVVVVGDSTACTLLPGLDAVGPSYEMQFENGVVIGCGVVSGTTAPFYSGGVNYTTVYTEECQGQANRCRIAGYRALPSEPHFVGINGRGQASIVVSTAHGSKVLDSGSPEWESVMLQAHGHPRGEVPCDRGQSDPPVGATAAASGVNGANAQNIGTLLKTPLVRGGGRPDAQDVAYPRMILLC